MKKSVLALLLVFSLSVSCLAGCKDESSASNGKISNVKQSEKFTVLTSKSDDGLEKGVFKSTITNFRHGLSVVLARNRDV